MRKNPVQVNPVLCEINLDCHRYLLLSLLHCNFILFLNLINEKLIVEYNFHITLKIPINMSSATENFIYIQKLPFVKQLLKENKKLKRRTKELKRLVRLISNNLPLFDSNRKCASKNKRDEDEDEDIIDLTSNDDYNDDDTFHDLPSIKIKKENIRIIITEENTKPIEKNRDDEVQVEEETEEDEEVQAEEDEEVQAEAEEKEDEEEEEEVQVEEEEEAQEEEEEVQSKEEEEEVQSKEEEEEEEEEEVYEVIIKGKTYYTSNEISGVIYGVDTNGDVSIEVGSYKDSKPVFKK